MTEPVHCIRVEYFDSIASTNFTIPTALLFLVKVLLRRKSSSKFSTYYTKALLINLMLASTKAI